MGLFSNLFRLNIEWLDDSKDTMIYRYPFKNSGKEVNNDSSLTVRESQVAMFVHKGVIADVFTPGVYELKTQILPILTKLAAWKYKFETPITCDVYFVNTKQFTNIKWGTKNPFMMRDPEFGVIRVRGFGSFSYRVDDAPTFMRELSSTNSTFRTGDIQDYLKGMVVSGLTDAVGESKISAIDLAGNTMEFQTIIQNKVQDLFHDIGLELTNLVIENMSVPEEVEKAIDERSRYGILGDATDTMMKVSAAQAMRDAANNQGAGGAFMGAGMGAGMGMGMGNMMAGVFGGMNNNNNNNNQNNNQNNNNNNQNAGGAVCPKCGQQVTAGAKFCPHCGNQMPTASFCPDCGAKVPTGAKFCPSCGHKM